MTAKSRVAAVNPAEQWAAPLATALSLLCASGLPTRLGLDADEAGAVSWAILALASFVRGLLQAWRAPVAAAETQVDQDERIGRIVAAAVAREAARLAVVPPSERSTIREVVEPEAGDSTEVLR